MFTGIVEDVGQLAEIRPAGLTVVTALAEKILVGDSIAVNGVCLTVTQRSAGRLISDFSAETISRTTLGDLRSGEGVNLETPLTLAKPLGGHYLQGHVDTVGTIREIRQLPGSWTLSLDFPSAFLPLVVERGSIGVDGVSLTVASIQQALIRIAVIPHTWAHTTMSGYRPGRKVNLEFDLIGKYVLRYLSTLSSAPGGTITLGFLKEQGY